MTVALPLPLPPSKSRGRRRSAESESAILCATIDLLKEKPLRDVTIEAIAQRAGVGKATIYKWWPSKAYVALDAFLEKMTRAVNVPDTGSAEKDFAEQLRAVIRFYLSSTGRIFCQFIAEGQSDPEFAALFRERFLQPRRESVEIIWQRGVERGQIDGTLKKDIVLDLIYGPMIFRLLAGHAPLDGDEADALMAAVFRGVGNSSADVAQG